MLIALLCCLLLLLATTSLHYEVLVGLSRGLPPLKIPPRLKLILVICSAFGSHALQILLFGATYYLLPRLLHGMACSGTLAWSWRTCLYFSAETFTSLGLGDIAPTGPIRIIAGSECLNGLLLIGWSASYTYIAMERFWQQQNGR